MRFDRVSYDLDLGEDERCFYHAALAKGHRPMCLGVSDRALFIARERFLKLHAYTMERIPLTDVKEVVLSRDRSSKDLVKGTLFLLFGLVGIVAIGFGSFSAPDIKPPPIGVAGAIGSAVVGILLLIDRHWRLALTISTSEKHWRWRPHLFDDRNEARNLREGFLDACRYVGIPTRRLDLVNETEVKGFWRWFEERAKQGHVDQAAVRARIKKLCDRLDVVIKPNRIRACCDLILSANYARDAFPIVDELVLAAPPIEGWSIIAFLPPEQLIETYNFEGVDHSLEDLSFVTYSDGFDLAVVIYADLQTIPENVIRSLFNDLLGEYESVCGVKYLDIFDSSELDEDFEVRHISELHAVVEDFHHFKIG